MMVALPVTSGSVLFKSSRASVMSVSYYTLPSSINMLIAEATVALVVPAIPRLVLKTGLFLAVESAQL